MHSSSLVWLKLAAALSFAKEKSDHLQSFGTEMDCTLFLLFCRLSVSSIIQLLACLFWESLILASGSLFT